MRPANPPELAAHLPALSTFPVDTACILMLHNELQRELSTDRVDLAQRPFY